MKQFLTVRMLIVVVLAMALGLNACKKDEETTGPGPGPSPTQKGSGRVGFTYNTGSGDQTLTISGNGQWPPSGEGVASALSSDGKTLNLVAYKQTSSKIRETAGARFSFLYLVIYDPNGIRPGLFTGEGEAGIGIDIDTSAVDSLAYRPVSGSSSLTIDSVSSSRFVGRFSGTFQRLSDGATMTVTNGTIEANLGSGLFLGGDDGGNGGGGGGGGGPFDFPLPDVGNVGGVLGVANTISSAGGMNFEYKIGFAAFFGASTSDYVYAGNVSVNSTNLDTMMTAAGPVYMIPSSRNPSTQPNVTFDGSSSASFSVAGSGSVTAFNASVTAPTLSVIQTPAPNSTVSRSTNLNVTWNGTGADTVMVMVFDQQGHSVVKSRLPNTGNVTISASEMSNFVAGSGFVQVVKYRYAVHAAGGKNYILVAETISMSIVTFN